MVAEKKVPVKVLRCYLLDRKNQECGGPKKCLMAG